MDERAASSPPAASRRPPATVVAAFRATGDGAVPPPHRWPSPGATVGAAHLDALARDLVRAIAHANMAGAVVFDPGPEPPAAA